MVVSKEGFQTYTVSDIVVGVDQVVRVDAVLRVGALSDAEHIGGLSAGMHTTLLNSRPDSTSDNEPIAIFNAWPKDWDAAFRLLARGGFIISAAQRGGTIPLAEVAVAARRSLPARQSVATGRGAVS